MKTTKYIIIYLLAIGVFVSGCKKFEDFQIDPNKPSTGAPYLLLPYLISDVFYSGDPTAWGAAAQQLFYAERRESPQYWGWNADGFGWYADIRQAQKMIEEATKTNAMEYIPIAKFFTQLSFYEQTRKVGDIPYSQAMKAESDNNVTPKYDSQKSVFIGILNELEKINEELIPLEGKTISGDLLYDGDLKKWRKLINSYRLKILMDLSMKESDAELRIKEQFKQIFTNPSKYPCFEDNDDMPRFKFFDQENNRYPTYNRVTTKFQQKLTSTVIDHLKLHFDPRIFSYAEPAWPKDYEDWTEAQKASYRADFKSYKGVDPGIEHGEGTQQNVSNLHWRYYERPTGEDYVKYSFAELNFIIAEAALRNWIQADANSYFRKGIAASMEFYDTPSNQIDAYLARPENNLSAELKSAIEQVNMEKYIAFFMNSSWEAYFNQRRMAAHRLGPDQDGVPHYKVGPSHYVTAAPIRWEYPRAELTDNEANVKEAIQQQFNGENLITGKMWLIK